MKHVSPRTINHVIHAFVQAEAHKLVDLPDNYAAMIATPDFESLAENLTRSSILTHLLKRSVLSRVPSDTQWYESELSKEDASLVLTIADPYWVSLAAHRTRPMEDREWIRPILFGHDGDGPWCILEGNHRLTAWVNSEKESVPVYVGISAQACPWHWLDWVFKNA